MFLFVLFVVIVFNYDFSLFLICSFRSFGLISSIAGLSERLFHSCCLSFSVSLPLSLPCFPSSSVVFLRICRFVPCRLDRTQTNVCNVEKSMRSLPHSPQRRYAFFIDALIFCLSLSLSIFLSFLILRVLYRKRALASAAIRYKEERKKNN